MTKNCITRRSFIEASACLLLAGAGLTIAPPQALAATAYSDKVSFVAGGKTYSGQAMISNGDGTSITAYALCRASSSVPAGYIGADIYVALYGTHLIKASRTAFNNTSTQYFQVATNSISGTSGSYYQAYANIYGWNGSDYSLRQTSYTPNVGRKSLNSIAINEYPINRSGLSYGSIFSTEYVGHEPDLVAAVSESGTEGFVYLSDLHQPTPLSPQEAVALYGHEDQRSIPLVDVDGNQLDEFVICLGGGFYDEVRLTSQ